MALLIHSVIGPSAVSMAVAARSTASASATSAATTWTRPPFCSSSRRACSRRSAPRATRPTAYPRSTRARAVARPIPALPPVMTATCCMVFVAFPSSTPTRRVSGTVWKDTTCWSGVNFVTSRTVSPRGPRSGSSAQGNGTGVTSARCRPAVRGVGARRVDAAPAVHAAGRDVSGARPLRRRRSGFARRDHREAPCHGREHGGSGAAARDRSGGPSAAA